MNIRVISERAVQLLIPSRTQFMMSSNQYSLLKMKSMSLQIR